MESDVVCLRVPLKSYLRIRTARMSMKIIRDSIIILEEHEMNKNKNMENDKNHRDQDQLIDRIVKLEKSLKTMEKLLRGISKKLNQEWTVFTFYTNVILYYVEKNKFQIIKFVEVWSKYKLSVWI